MTDEISAIGASFQHQIDDHRALVLQMHMPSDCTLEDFTKQLGKLAAASDWLKAKTHLPTAQNLLALKKDGLKRATEALFSAQTQLDIRRDQWNRESREAGRREWRMTPAQRQEEERLKAEIAKHQAQVHNAQQEILTEELLVADMARKVENAVASSADRNSGMPAGQVSGDDESGRPEAQFDP